MKRENHREIHVFKTRHKQIWHEVLHMHEISLLPTPKSDIMEPKSSRWCKFYKVKVHHTKDCYQLKKKIERLVQEGHLKKYVWGDVAQTPRGSNSRGQDTSRNLNTYKDKELNNGKKQTCAPYP